MISIVLGELILRGQVVSFKELEIDQIPFASSFLRGEEQGRKRLYMLVERLEHSWDSLFKTTASVMSVAVATVSPEMVDNARDVVAGMFWLFVKMTEAMVIGGGLGFYDNISFMTSSDIDKSFFQKFKDESDRIDRAGLIMSKSADEFSLVFMETLLAELPLIWSKHLQKIVDASKFFEKEIDKNDSEYLKRIIADEQYELIKNFGEIITESVYHESSIQVKSWLNSAKQFFYKERSTGFDSKTAFRNVIRALGFPNVFQEIS